MTPEHVEGPGGHRGLSTNGRSNAAHGNAAAVLDATVPVDNLAAALWVAEHLGPVFPVDHPALTSCAGAHSGKNPCDGKRGKHPTVKWGERATRNVAQITTWFYGKPRNIGLACKGAGLLVVDEDVVDAFAAIADELGQTIPPTFTVSTSRGLHYYFTAPEGIALGNGLGSLAGRGIDVRGTRGDGGYVVAPGSLHATGALYLPTDNEATPAPCPSWLVEALQAPAPLRAVEALDDTPTSSTSGSRLGDRVVDGRHDAVMRSCCSWRARGIPYDEALDLLGRRYADLAQPPERDHDYTWGEAEAVLDDVYRRYPEGTPVELAERYEPAVPAPPAVAELSAFWTARPALAHIRAFARARRCSPWAVLGVVLARVVVAVPPEVVLPALVGGRASLNLFVALVGPSGSGKGAAEAAAAEAVAVGEVEVVTIGSGEGIAHLYAHREVKTRAVVRDRYAVLFTVPEVDNLTALGARQGATLLPQLRSAWSGERLGFGYADPNKALPIDRHTYRLGLALGVQPGRAAALLDDVDGGTPQRFVWLPTTDPSAPDEAPPCPEPMRWATPAPPPGAYDRPVGLLDVTVDPVVRAEVDAASLSRLRSSVDALDGHAMLCRLKVAAALGLLDGRLEVSAEDWQLAGDVMRVSDATRARVVAELSAKRSRENTARGLAEGERAVLTDERRHGAKARRVSLAVQKALARRGDWTTWRDVNAAINSEGRDVLAEVLDSLVEAAVVEVDEEGTRPRYRLNPKAKP